jgi:hypothetical protein
MMAKTKARVEGDPKEGGYVDPADLPSAPTVGPPVDMEGTDIGMMNAEAIRARALELKQNINRASIDLAEVLHEIYHKELWKDYGYESFQAYSEGELDVGYRSAMYSIKIIETLNRHAIPMDQARQLGWGRLRAILPHITERNVTGVLDMASTRSVRQIEAEFADGGIVSGSPVASQHAIRFLCTEAEASAIYDALDEAKRRLETDVSSSAMEFIAQEWMMYSEGGVSNLSLDNIVDFVYRNYGVRLERIADEEQPDIEEIVDEAG